jgi:flagellar hook-length control protein FliK
MSSTIPMTLPTPAPVSVVAAGAAADLLALLGSPLAAAGETGFHAMVQQALGKLPGKEQPAGKQAHDEDPKATDPVAPEALPVAATPLAPLPQIPVPAAIISAPVITTPASSTAAQPKPAETPAPSALAAKPESAPAHAVEDQPAPAPATPGPGPSAAILAPATASAPDATAPAPITHPVTAQVFDKVAALVSRGEGTHRITIRLDPEHLGEVRVVMTVRDGSVHVRLAAGERDTRTALADGSSELRRVLELSGAGETKVVVRELPRDLGTGTNTNSADSNGNGWSLGHGTTTDSGENPGHRAGTRADHPATDGADHGPRQPAAASTGHRSSETLTRRHAGVDVSM